MWRVLLGLLVVLVTLGLAIAAYDWQKADASRSVSTVEVSRGSIESQLQLTGTVINDRTVTLTALLDGEIMAIRAREGDLVKAGAILAELDSRQARALLDKASAEMIMQEQALNAANRNLVRIRRMSRAGSASTQALDDSQDAVLEARAALHAARATLTLNQLRLDNAQIRAPFAGIVIEKSAETGQWLEAGTPLFKLVATEGTVIEADVNASDWSRISVGQKVSLASEVNAGARWNSEINWIAPTVAAENGQGRNVAIRIPPTQAAPALLLGQEVDVDVSLERVDNALLIPLQVLLEAQPGEFSVFVLNGNIARKRKISIGLTSLNDAEVVDGLSEGEEVIDPAGIPLQDGLAVQVR